MAQLVARLVRNEKVGGSNPPSSTTGRHPIADVGFLYAWARSCGACCCVDWCRWCSGRLLGRVVGPGRCVCRWAAARPRDIRAASFARRVVSKPGQAPPPPTGTAAWPSGPSGAPPHRRPLRCCVADVSGQAPPPPTGTAAWPSGPSCALHTSGAGSLLVPQLWLLTSNFARNSSMTHSSIEFASLELQRFSGISKNDHDKLRAKFGWRWCRCRPRHRNQALNLPPALRPGRFVHCRPPYRRNRPRTRIGYCDMDRL